MDTPTIPPGVTVGPLDTATGSRTIYRHGVRIGSVTHPAHLGPETAETYYSVSVEGQSYRSVCRPLMAAVAVLVALTS